jgi:beta-galactosidase
VVEATTDGWPALIRAGGLHYLAGWPDAPTFLRILNTLCTAQGIETDPLPEGLRRRDSATHHFYFNYNSVEVDWDGQIIPPAGLYWRAKG